MTVTTGLSGNELYCLNLKGYKPGNIVVGNSVYSLGLLRGISSGFKTILGGEIGQVTQLIEEGRETAYNRMVREADLHHATGITGVTNRLIYQAGNIEFLSIGSMVFADKCGSSQFTTSADGQELFAQLDAGYRPICFAFGNVAYSLGITRGLIGSLKVLRRGEIKEYSDMFNETRHLALERIKAHAKQHNANAVCGIQTTILPFIGNYEMLMIGTASYNPQLDIFAQNGPVTSDLTNIEMWNVAKMGYLPMQLLLGTSVYSLGFVGGVSAFLKSFARGEISELTQLIYDARENALQIINDEAKSIGADDVLGVKTYVYELGNGLIEFLAIGTAVKKVADAKTQSEQLPPQAIVVDQDTFFYSSYLSPSANCDASRPFQSSLFNLLIPFMLIIGVVVYALVKIFTS